MVDRGDPVVLVVEDEERLAEVYARWLGEEYTVRTVLSGEEALSTIDEAVDVVLLDRRLPGASGDEVLRTIRERGCDCRVALVTAVDPGVDILDLPADDYVVKPPTAAELRSVVDRLVELASYDERVRTSYALASRLSALERETPRHQLESVPEYVEGRKRLRRLRDEIDASLSAFDPDDFELVYRSLDADGAGTDPDSEAATGAGAIDRKRGPTDDTRDGTGRAEGDAKGRGDGGTGS